MSTEVDKTLSPGPEELRCLPSGGAAGHEVWKGQLRTEGETQAGVTLWTHRKDRTWRRLELSAPLSTERVNRTQTWRRSLDLEIRLGGAGVVRWHKGYGRGGRPEADTEEGRVNYLGVYYALAR